MGIKTSKGYDDKSGLIEKGGWVKNFLDKGTEDLIEGGTKVIDSTQTI